jgi:hypothetical protein
MPFDVSLILSLAKQLPAPHDAGLDEHEQAGLLTSRSSYQLRLTASKMQWHLKPSSLVTAALPCGIHTRFPILFKPWFEALAHLATHHMLCRIQRTIHLIDFPNNVVKPVWPGLAVARTTVHGQSFRITALS